MERVICDGLWWPGGGSGVADAVVGVLVIAQPRADDGSSRVYGSCQGCAQLVLTRLDPVRSSGKFRRYAPPTADLHHLSELCGNLYSRGASCRIFERCPRPGTAHARVCRLMERDGASFVTLRTGNAPVTTSCCPPPGAGRQVGADVGAAPAGIRSRLLVCGLAQPVCCLFEGWPGLHRDLTCQILDSVQYRHSVYSYFPLLIEQPLVWHPHGASHTLTNRGLMARAGRVRGSHG